MQTSEHTPDDAMTPGCRYNPHASSWPMFSKHAVPLQASTLDHCSTAHGKNTLFMQSTKPSVCRHVADLLGLEEGKDFDMLCMGEKGFGPLIDDLAREDWNKLSNNSDALSRYHPSGGYLCDIGVSAITANSDRWARGIHFSRATLRSNLAIMVYAPLLERGTWAFFAPLAWRAWVMLAATTCVVPLFVFFFEAVFSNQCAPPVLPHHLVLLMLVYSAL
jgi:hypothetical protein